MSTVIYDNAELALQQATCLFASCKRSLLLRISLVDAGSRDELISHVSSELCFPSCYGQNFDAMAEAMSDLDWILVGSAGGAWVERPNIIIIVFEGVDYAISVMPEEVRILFDLSHDAEKYYNEQNMLSKRKLAILFSR